MSIRLCPQSITRSRGTSRLAITNVLIFLSAVSAGSEADVPRCGVNRFFAAANKICCIAALNFADLLGHCKIIGAEEGGLMARLGRPMPVEISEAGLCGRGSGQAVLDCQTHQFGGRTHAKLLADDGRRVGNGLVG
jgi:hypothetical protein